MLKKVALLAVLFSAATQVQAQDDKMNSNAAPPPIVKPARDFVLLQLGWNTWQNKPDSIDTKPFGFVFNGFLCYDFPIKRSHFSFATGLGISTQVIFLNKQVIANTDSLGGQARFIHDAIGYKRYKFNTAYAQAPFELRYFANNLNRNKGFKAALGVQVGALLSGHTKAATSVGGINVNYKTNTKRYLSPWNFAASARIGWGNFAIFGTYNITNVYKDGQGPELTPMSVGICLSGL